MSSVKFSSENRKKFLFVLLLAVFIPFETILATQVTINQKDAVVWGQDQVITGTATGVTTNTAVLYLNGSQIPFALQSPWDTFSVTIWLGRGQNNIVVRVDSGGNFSYSDTLHFTLGYTPLPQLYAFATVSGRNVTLHSTIVANPDTASLTYQWSHDASNPSQATLSGTTDSTTTFSLPTSGPCGEYYFTLNGYTNTGDTVVARTFITVDSSGIKPFNILTDHSAWIDSAIVYGITPYIFVFEGHFSDIINKIPEIASLGVNAIWLQPVFGTHDGGQGYDITNYFSIRPDLGSPADLHTLVNTAHQYGLKVLFDFVPNHSSVYHPYAQDAINYGQNSHYYDFYQRQKDTAPYSSNEAVIRMGNMQFVYYNFWTGLMNLNYNNPEVQNWMIQAAEYWIKNYDIDGYRFDSGWAVDARAPGFMDTLRLALKRIKPSILLLAEAKATDPATFDANGFDAAYDWTNSTSWISQWVFETSYSTTSNPTIFNNRYQDTRASLLHNALTNYGVGYSPTSKIFRFMENNDTYRFLPTHDLARTEMVAALTFSLNGIPLIYNGQEIGASGYPYTSTYIFSPSSSIQSQDEYGLFNYYKNLVRIRKMFSAMYSNNFQELSVAPNAFVYGYRRWQGDQNIFGIINMGDSPELATIQMPVDSLHLDSTKTYYLSDLVTDQHYPVTENELASYNVTVDAYTTRLLILADTEVTTEVPPRVASTIPTKFELQQNYPNPFNPTTAISFDIPKKGNVTLQVYDVLGRKIATLADGTKTPGHYTAIFDVNNIASGIYFYVLRYDGTQAVKKMVLVK